jgi:type I restriction enzyme, S subunit
MRPLVNESNSTGRVPKLRFPEFKDTEAWDVKTLGDITFKTDKKNKEGKVYPIYSINNKEGFVPQTEQFDGVDSNERGYDTTIYKVIEKNTFAYNPARINIGSLGFSGDLNNIIISSLYVCFKSTKDVDYKFLLHFFATSDFTESVKNNTEGGIRSYLFYENFSRINIVLPTKKEEQQKIAAFLCSLDELISAQTQKLATLKAHKNGLMQQLFPAEGETMPNLRFPEFLDAREWEEYSLIQLAKFRRGSFPQPYGSPEWYDDINGMPFIQVFDVNDDLSLKPTTKNKISKLAAEQSVFIPKGTLIVTIQGSIGRVAITQYDAYIDRTLLLFENFLKPIEKLFFAYIIQNLFEIEKEKAPGEIIKTITKEVLSEFKVKLPGLPEQQKIAACLSSLDGLISAQTQKLTVLKVYKKGLMQQLFPSADKVIV